MTEVAAPPCAKGDGGGSAENGIDISVGFVIRPPVKKVGRRKLADIFGFNLVPDPTTLIKKLVNTFNMITIFFKILFKYVENTT